MRTSNFQLSTSNFEVKKDALHLLRRWTLNVGRSTFVFLLFTLATRTYAGSPARAPLPSLLQWQAAGAPHNPIVSINHHMGNIVDDLSDQKTDLPVQTQQKHVVGELDTIIKEIEEQMKQSGNGGGNPNPTKPMQRSTLAKGPGGSGPLHDAKSGTHQWGDLSPKEREQIMQSQTEGFPPGYEAVLSSYYNRLAQEKVGSETSASSVAGPTTQP